MTRPPSSDRGPRLNGLVTRRAVLRGTGAAIASSMFPPARVMGADSVIESVMDRLSTHMSEAAARPLPVEVIEKATHHVLDTIAAMTSGTELAPGRVALAFARTYNETVSTVVGSKLLKRQPLDADQVKQVTVRTATSEAALVDNREMPDICLQHMIAVMLVDRTASFKAAHDKARMQDANILRHRAKVRLVPDEELERRRPRREAIVDVSLSDGTQLTQRIDAVRGTVENPMPRNEVVAKCRELIAPILGSDRCNRLIDQILDIEKVRNMRSLRPLLQPE
jgi:2-methylcitrate dehydratase PrpD